MDFSRYNKNFSSSASNAVAYDEGLRKFMLGVYNNMSIGLAVTGVVAFLISQSPALMASIFGTPLGYLFMFAPLIFVFFFSFKIGSMSVSTARISFFAFSAIMGVSMATIFIAFTTASIFKTFFMTASVFGAMSIYGYTTKKDLTSMGSFLFMGLIGVIIISIANIFIGSSALEFVISLAALAIFIGLTAYDTQKLKQVYNQLGGTSEFAQKAGIMGALSLYIDFINIFIHLLQFFGDRR